MDRGREGGREKGLDLYIRLASLALLRRAHLGIVVWVGAFETILVALNFLLKEARTAYPFLFIFQSVQRPERWLAFFSKGLNQGIRCFMRSSVVLFLFPKGEKLKERNCLVFWQDLALCKFSSTNFIYYTVGNQPT